MTKKLRIGINLISFRDTKAIGTFVYVKRLLTQMSEMDMSNIHLIIYIQKHIAPNAFNIPSNCTHEIIYVPRLNSPLRRIIFEQTLFYKYLKKMDVFYTPSSTSLPWLTKYTKVFTVHDMIPFTCPQKYSWLKRQYVQLTTKLCLHIGNHIITVSQNSKTDIIKYAHITPSKISIIYNFITNQESVVQRGLQQVHTQDGRQIDLHCNYFLTVATLQPGKNIEGLLEAFSIFLHNNPHYFLYIVGNKGWGYQTIFDKIEELKLHDKVILTGYLDDSSLATLYEYCLGVVYTSFYEGFGIPPLEGFYHNKSCVASNNSSLPEVVGNAGILVDPYSPQSIAEGLAQFLSAHTYLERHIPTQIAKFAPAKQTQAFLSLITNLSYSK